MKKSRSIRIGRLKAYVIPFFIILFLSLMVQSIFDPLFVFREMDYLFQPYDLRGYAKGVIYIGAYLLSVVALVLILGLASSLIIGIIFMVLFIFYAVDFFVQLIGINRGFSIDKYTLVMNEAGHYEFLINYMDYIVYALLLASAVIAILYFLRRNLFESKYSAKILLLVIVAIMSVYFASTKVSSITLSAFPVLAKFPAIMLWYEMRPGAVFMERVLDANITTTKEAKARNIIWIIDESITGSYLSINGYAKNTTPYLSSLLESGDIVTNYGIVNSVSNCSSPSNFYLRLGLNPRMEFDFENSLPTLPTIYHYAKRAGYTTWLYDSQTSKDTLQNRMSVYDIQQVDHFMTLDRATVQYKRDNIFLDDISKILKDKRSEKKFIVMVKFGAHFPYLLSYDKTKTFFEPAMETTYGGMNMKNREKLVNTYLNAIKNNTDIYLNSLLSKIDLKDTVVFYTSDHGQNILENGSILTHCNKKNIVKNEVTVPLLVFTKNAKEQFPYDSEKHYSQIEIFPTTLSLMGYGDRVIKKYGNTLWEGIPKKEQRKYYIPYHGDIGLYDE